MKCDKQSDDLQHLAGRFFLIIQVFYYNINPFLLQVQGISWMPRACKRKGIIPDPPPVRDGR